MAKQFNLQNEQTTWHCEQISYIQVNNFYMKNKLTHEANNLFYYVNGICTPAKKVSI